MIMTRLDTLFGTDTNTNPPVVPTPSPKSIPGLTVKINDLLGNAMWLGIICGLLGLIMVGAMIALHNKRGPGDGGEAAERVGWVIAGVLIVVSAPIIIQQFV